MDQSIATSRSPGSRKPGFFGSAQPPPQNDVGWLDLLWLRDGPRYYNHDMEGQHRFNRSWAIGITAVGFTVITVGVVGDASGWFKEVWTDLFIEFGAGIALVAIIVYVEVRLISQETAAVERLLDKRQEELLQQIEELEADVQRLSERVDGTRPEPDAQ